MSVVKGVSGTVAARLPRADLGFLGATLGVAAISALAAVALTGLGTKSAIVAVVALGVALGLVIVRQRALFVFLLMLLSLQFLFHKSFGPVYDQQYSGAPALFVSNVGVFVTLLYVLWIADGSLLADLRRAYKRPAILVPGLAMLATLPSVLVAEDLYLAAAELFRMTWIFLLYVYVVLRIRTRREVVFVVGTLFIVALTQSAIAGLQWSTGSSLGLGALGEEAELGVRPLVEGELIRPSGTVVHADFLAALVAPIALLALSLAVQLRGIRVRILCLATAAIAATPIVLAMARAALLGEAVAASSLIAFYVYRRHLGWKSIFGGGVAILVLGIAFWSQIESKVFATFGTDQFRNEVASRLELNGIALTMIGDHPILGIGLNNFALALERYDVYGLLFAGNPVHNIYLVILSETGLVGLIAMLVMFVVFLRIALRLARSGDRLLSAIGVAVAAAQVFFYVDGLLTFSLREEMPMTLYWLFAGLSAACLGIAERARNGLVEGDVVNA